MLLPHEATQPHPALRALPETSGSFTLSKPYRPAWAEVDLDAIRHNVGLLARLVAPAGLMAVVKADGYGHGAVAAAYAALEAGATWLGVALVEEGVELRDAGIDMPILLLSQPPVEAARAVVDAGLTPVVYSRRFIDALAKAAADAGVDPHPVHLKVDTGMHRVGCSPSEALDLAPAIRKHRELHLQGLLTHFAVADEPDHPFTAQQIAVFEAVRKELARTGIRPPLVHAANSAGVLTAPEARYDLVRCGIAIYGIAPAAELDGRLPLKPALSLQARVSFVRRLEAGERLSYGLRYELDESVHRGHRAHRLRRRRAPPARRGRRRGADRRAAQAHRRGRHDGPAAGRPGLRRRGRRRRGRHRGRAARPAGRRARSPPPSGPSSSGPSPTRCAAASGTGSPGATSVDVDHGRPRASGSGTGPAPTPGSPSCGRRRARSGRARSGAAPRPPGRRRCWSPPGWSSGSTPSC